MKRIHWLQPDDPPTAFPPVSRALDEPPGLLAAGGDLSPERLVAAYRRGIFPWYSPGEPVMWWSPDPREVLLPAELHVSRSLRRVLARWSRYELIAIDEVGYVPMADIGAEFLFQVIAERAEKAAVILTTNLPFSEWTQVIPNARLCKALLDRITDRAHILETGTESYRFRRTVAKQKRKAN